MTDRIIFTIDWEDFRQLGNYYKFGKVLKPTDAIDRETDSILELLAKYDIKATFFILGMLAKDKPKLVRLIQENGHEIALHGFNHKSLPSQSRDAIREDIVSSRKLISDITGEAVLGYRAPFFSMTRERLFVLEDLAELGFQYDSSIFPASIARYYIPDYEGSAGILELTDSRRIAEIPMSTTKIGKYQVGTTGGGYFRLLPLAIQKSLIKSRKSIDPLMFYFHPYEFSKEYLKADVYKADGYTFTFAEKIKDQHFRNFRHSSIIQKLDYFLTKHKSNAVTCQQYADELYSRNVVIEGLTL